MSHQVNNVIVGATCSCSRWDVGVSISACSVAFIYMHVLWAYGPFLPDFPPALPSALSPSSVPALCLPLCFGRVVKRKSARWVFKRGEEESGRMIKWGGGNFCITMQVVWGLMCYCGAALFTVAHCEGCTLNSWSLYRH